MTRRRLCLSVRRKRRKSRTKRHPFRGKIIIVSLFLMVLLVLSEIGISSASEELTQTAAEKYIITSVNNSVEKMLEKYNETDFVGIKQDDLGNVLSVEADTNSINRFKTDVSEEITKALNGRKSVGVPFGSFTSIALLNGRGFDIPLKLNYVGTADIEVKSEFVSAGINQTCHRITLIVHSNVYSESNQFSIKMQKDTDFVVSETIIVGSVPDIATLAGLGIF